MHLGKTLTFLALGSGALSFKIRAFTGDDCTGEAKEVNVWDNTCRNDNTIPTRSFRALAYGAKRQRATFWLYGYCSNSPPPDGPGNRSFWADGDSDNFLLDKCVTLGYEAKTYGSHSA